ncbi:MAG: hypothetical protein MI824_05760 [Hyphomicrobiales bacterium]|nr:hypothetical protein [Hyphomicrobiales bacterium]
MARKKRYPLPKRFNAALSEAAYARLRAIDADTGLGNNYCLTVLLENLDEIADRDRLAEVYRRFIHEQCGPEEP